MITITLEIMDIEGKLSIRHRSQAKEATEMEDKAAVILDASIHTILEMIGGQVVQLQ
jgi:hypothetical protein